MGKESPPKLDIKSGSAEHDGERWVVTSGPESAKGGAAEDNAEEIISAQEQEAKIKIEKLKQEIADINRAVQNNEVLTRFGAEADFNRRQTYQFVEDLITLKERQIRALEAGDDPEKVPDEIKAEEEAIAQAEAEKARVREIVDETDAKLLSRKLKKELDGVLENNEALPLSKEEFNTYFFSKKFEVHPELKQKSTGDCYLISAIHSMIQSPHFEAIARSSMKRLDDGSWEVTIPPVTGGEPSEFSKTVTITQEELLPQWNRNYLRKLKWDEEARDTRFMLGLADGKEGLRVLEAAYIKFKFGEMSLNKAEGGTALNVFSAFGGEYFNQRHILGYVERENKKESPYVTLSTFEEGTPERYAVEKFLDEFDPELQMATVTSDWRRGSWIIPGTDIKIHGKHSYSVRNIDPKTDTITLINPFRHTKPIVLTREQFKENFIEIVSSSLNVPKVVERYQALKKTGQTA